MPSRIRGNAKPAPVDFGPETGRFAVRNVTRRGPDWSPIGQTREMTRKSARDR